MPRGKIDLRVKNLGPYAKKKNKLPEEVLQQLKPTRPGRSYSETDSQRTSETGTLDEQPVVIQHRTRSGYFKDSRDMNFDSPNQDEPSKTVMSATQLEGPTTTPKLPPHEIEANAVRATVDYVTSQQDYLAEQDCNVGAQWAYIDWSRDGLSFGGRVNATMLTTEAGEKGDAGSPQRFERGTSASDDSKVRRDISVLNPGLISTSYSDLHSSSRYPTSENGSDRYQDTEPIQELHPMEIEPCPIESSNHEPDGMPEPVWRMFGEEWAPEFAPQLDDPGWQSFRTVVAGQQGFYRFEGDHNSNARGAYADVSKREAWFEGRVRVHVAVKRLYLLKVVDPLRPKTSDIAERCRKRLNKETKIWMTLNHPNIVPLLGFHDNNAFCMISPWFENGNIVEYLHRTGPTAREKLLLIQQVASGVAYLHGLEPAIVHGDLKPDNIVVDNFGVSRIIDFGLSRVVQDAAEAGFQSSSSRTGGNSQWLAPELLMRDGKARESSSDVYSFACTALYIMSGTLPFIPGYATDSAVCFARFKGAPPMTPDVAYPEIDSIPGLQLLLQRCWAEISVDRPAMSLVVTDLDSL